MDNMSHRREYIPESGSKNRLPNSLDVNSPVTLSWQDMSVFVRIPKDHAYLPRNCQPNNHQSDPVRDTSLIDIDVANVDSRPIANDVVSIDVGDYILRNDCSNQPEKVKFEKKTDERLNQTRETPRTCGIIGFSVTKSEDHYRNADISHVSQSRPYQSETQKANCEFDEDSISRCNTDELPINAKGDTEGHNRNKNHSDDARDAELHAVRSRYTPPSDNSLLGIGRLDTNENYPSVGKDTNNDALEPRPPLTTDSLAYIPCWRSVAGVPDKAQVDVLAPTATRLQSCNRPRTPDSGSDSVSGNSNTEVNLSALVAQLESTGSCAHRWKSVLRGVTGIAHPGTITAVMGPSGSGKSTLLNTLSCRSVRGCHVSGTVRLNGIKVKQETRHLSAFVSQSHLFLPNLTIKETLTFRAMLEMGASTTDARTKVVSDILTETHLTQTADTLVGIPGIGTGISEGDAKRLSFACQLISNPPLIFYDEPITGLDTFMIRETMQMFQTLARRGHTVVCSVHQPSSSVFATFHKILLLKDGRMLFTGTSKEAVKFFKCMGIPCPTHFNPADFFLEVLSHHCGDVNHSRAVAEAISQKYAWSHEAKAVLQEIQDLTLLARGKAKDVKCLLYQYQGNTANWSRQLRVLVWRTWTCHRRERTRVWTMMFSGLLQGIFIGVIFYRMDVDGEGKRGNDQTMVMNVNGALFVMVVVSCYFICLTVTAIFPPWIPVMLRDNSSGLYGVAVFYLAILLVELPVLLFLPVSLVSIDYWMVGLFHDARSFFVALGVLSLGTVTSVSFGYAVSALVADCSIAFIVTQVFMFPLLILSGFLVNYESLSAALHWIKYVSWFRHANELVAVNQWTHVDRILCPANTGDNSTIRCTFENGLDVLEELSFSAHNDLPNYLNMMTLIVVFQFSAFVCLLIRARWYYH